ncbi:hypothetical protein HDC90_004221 [Pedobacter sp. AK013]|uniref:hypothetical protein n=1 Tax=Pedobacter sp. AK013 TaxID=2723071 RepID=UPI00161F9AC0|nr:hypothetical protein [Pedobacter sp. AK013]MBB6239568.1 hypothetical protein [Pedobacter sp. AK013]
MKRLLILLFVAICSSYNIFAADKNPIRNAVDSAALIKKIQSDFVLINKQLKFFKKKTKDAFGMSAEGGEVIGYYNKGVLKKIHCIFYGETGKAETDYYFNNKKLFFLYKKEFFYDKPMYLKDFKIKKTIETRYYLAEDKVIKAMVKPNASLVLSRTEIKEALKQVMDILNEK